MHNTEPTSYILRMAAQSNFVLLIVQVRLILYLECQGIDKIDMSLVVVLDSIITCILNVGEFFDHSLRQGGASTFAPAMWSNDSGVLNESRSAAYFCHLTSFRIIQGLSRRKRWKMK